VEVAARYRATLRHDGDGSTTGGTDEPSSQR